MRVAVVGAGAIGGFLAAALARSGISVGVVARGEHLRAITRRGLSVESDLGAFTATVEASDDLRTLGNFDVVIATFKSHQWAPLLPQFTAIAASNATIVTLQNGLPFWYEREPPLHSVDPGGSIGRLFSDERIVGGVVHVSGSVVGHGKIAQSGGLRYVLGDPNGRPNARVAELVATMQSAGLAAENDEHIRATVWLKLVNNVGLNSVSALRRLRIRSMLADPATREEVRGLMIETLDVGRAIGAVSAADVDARIAYAARLADVKTSMLQDLERGRDLEVEPILGAVVELAERCGVDVPRVRATYAALRSLPATRDP
jgi:2-dehydropantoate 2-reductase